MRATSLANVILAIAFAAAPCAAQAGAASPGSSSDMAQRIEELERQVGDLRAEVAALKGATLPASAETGQQNLAAPAAAPVQPEGEAPSLASLLGPTRLSGLVDVYYSQNFNHPDSRLNGLRAFDTNANQFALNLVELAIDKQPDPGSSRTGYHIALGFGQAMNAVNGSDPGGLGFDQYLKEAYFSYLAPVGHGLQFDVGKFVTPHGAEVIETQGNWNYSRGLLFTYAVPFYHFGMRARYAFSDKYSVSGFFVNGWNNVVDNNPGKTYGASFSWNLTKKLGITENYMAGPEQNGPNTSWRQLSDTVVTYAATDRLSFMANFDYGRGDRVASSPDPVYWTGVAGYVRYMLNGQNAIAARYEYYDDKFGVTTGGFASPTPQHLHEFTGTYEHLLARHILTRFEFRRDMSNRPVFSKGATPAMAQNTATAGLVFTFDSHEGK